MADASTPESAEQKELVVVDPADTKKYADLNAFSKALGEANDANRSNKTAYSIPNAWPIKLPNLKGPEEVVLQELAGTVDALKQLVVAKFQGWKSNVAVLRSGDKQVALDAYVPGDIPASGRMAKDFLYDEDIEMIVAGLAALVPLEGGQPVMEIAQAIVDTRIGMLQAAQNAIFFHNTHNDTAATMAEVDKWSKFELVDTENGSSVPLSVEDVPFGQRFELQNNVMSAAVADSMRLQQEKQNKAFLKRLEKKFEGKDIDVEGLVNVFYSASTYDDFLISMKEMGKDPALVMPARLNALLTALFSVNAKSDEEVRVAKKVLQERIKALDINPLEPQFFYDATDAKTFAAALKPTPAAAPKSAPQPMSAGGPFTNPTAPAKFATAAAPVQRPVQVGQEPSPPATPGMLQHVGQDIYRGDKK